MLLSKRKNRKPTALLGALVLLSVCSLTARLATRYYFPADGSIQSVKVAKVHAPDAKRQRLNKNAADWHPPVFNFTQLQSPSYYPRVAPAGPPIPGLFLEESLYNRPPPLSIT